MEEKKTVLIVEDEKSIVDIVRFNLEKEGYAVLTAYDGEAGLAGFSSIFSRSRRTVTSTVRTSSPT